MKKTEAVSRVLLLPDGRESKDIIQQDSHSLIIYPEGNSLKSNQNFSEKTSEIKTKVSEGLGEYEKPPSPQK